jgi:hypothetical protein
MPAGTPDILADEARQTAAAAFITGAAWKMLFLRGGKVIPSEEVPEEGEDPIPGTLHAASMRLFAHGCPAHALREVIQALADSSPISSVVANGARIPGTWYHRAAWWARDTSTPAGHRAGDGTFTVFWQLSDAVDSEEGVVEDTCAAQVTIRYVWDSPTVEELPALVAGTTVRIGGLSRDPETALYTYYVTTTVSKTQTTGEVTQANTTFETTQELDITRIRPDGTDHLGNAVTTWAVGVSAGVEVTQRKRMNEDCTHDLAQQKVTEKAVSDAEVRKERTLFIAAETHQNRGQVAALPAPVAASGGVHEAIINAQSGRGRYTTSKTVTTEQAVSEAQKSGTKTIFQTEEAVVDRHQPANTSLTVPAATGGVVVAKAGQKTDGGLLDVTTKTTTEQNVLEAQKSGTKTVFQIESVVTDRGQPANTDLTVPAASGGAVVTKAGQKTDGGLLDVTTKTVTEQPVLEAQRSGTGTIFHVESTVLDRGQAPVDVSPQVASGGVIITKTGQKTDGGLMDVTTRTVTERSVLEAQKSGAKTIFQVETTVLDRNQPANTSLAVPAATGGVVVTKVGQKTDGGLLDVTTRTVEEQAVSAATLENEVTALGSRAVQVDAGQPVGTPLVASLSEAGVLVTKAGRKTNGNLLEVTTTTETPVAATHVVTITSRGRTVTRTIFYNQTLGGLQVLLNALDPDNTNELSVRLNRNGLLDGEITATPAQVGTISAAWADASDRLAVVDSAVVSDPQGASNRQRWFTRNLVYYRTARGFGLRTGEQMYEGGYDGFNSQLTRQFESEAYHIVRVVQVKQWKVYIQDDGTLNPNDMLTAPAGATDLFIAPRRPWGNS